MSALSESQILSSESPAPMLTAGQQAIDFEWHDITGQPIRLSDYRGKKVLLAFYRFAMCPFCNLRLHNLAKHQSDWKHRGFQVLVFIQSPEKAVKITSSRHTAPFPIMADYKKEIYARYGVASRAVGLLIAMFLRPHKLIQAMLKGYIPWKIQGDPTLMPAEFLINSDGTIHTAHYGKNASDHLNMARLKAFMNG